MATLTAPLPLPLTETVVSKDVEVFALHGATPEVLAYAMAKYSRSALSMREAIVDISEQNASTFLNTFYFQYGHRSIADLAHFPMAVENISLLAAIEVVDEQRWDGQERSTRYQDFSKRLYYTPAGLTREEQRIYESTMSNLFDGYDGLFAHALELFRQGNPQPADMNAAAYERTLRARTFDVARYLLPMGALTSVGQVLNARTLEGQVSRMLASDYAEVRDIAARLRHAAATEPAYNPHAARVDSLLRTVAASGGSSLALAELRECVLPKVVVAPTLLKHADVHTYRREVEKLVRAEIPILIGEGRSIVSGTIPGMPAIEATRVIDPELEIACTLLYQYSNLPFTFWLNWLTDEVPSEWVADFLRRVLALRGAHDELLPAFRAAGGIVFDIHLDIGGMRDLHRHRRANHFAQTYTFKNFASPEAPWPFLQLLYKSVIADAQLSYNQLRKSLLARGAEASAADYLLPLGAKRRFLMKMDVAEIAYIAQLRTQPAGHISYRRVAWEMFTILARYAPAVAAGIRDKVTDPSEPIDFFKR